MRDPFRGQRGSTGDRCSRWGHTTMPVLPARVVVVIVAVLFCLDGLQCLCAVNEFEEEGKCTILICFNQRWANVHADTDVEGRWWFRP